MYQTFTYKNFTACFQMLLFVCLRTDPSCLWPTACNVAAAAVHAGFSLVVSEAEWRYQPVAALLTVEKLQSALFPQLRHVWAVKPEAGLKVISLFLYSDYEKTLQKCRWKRTNFSLRKQTQKDWLYILWAYLQYIINIYSIYIHWYWMLYSFPNVGSVQ